MVASMTDRSPPPVDTDAAAERLRAECAPNFAGLVTLAEHNTDVLALLTEREEMKARLSALESSAMAGLRLMAALSAERPDDIPELVRIAMDRYEDVVPRWERDDVTTIRALRGDTE